MHPDLHPVKFQWACDGCPAVKNIDKSGSAHLMVSSFVVSPRPSFFWLQTVDYRMRASENVPLDAFFMEIIMVNMFDSRLARVKMR
jgi:hypothetical protein